MWTKDATAHITRQRILRVAELGCLAIGLVFIILFLTGNVRRSSIRRLSHVSGGATTVWRGWPSIENLFIFGDSYSDQSFDCFSTQPSHGNPFGNPEYSLSLASGSVWAHFLTLNYNQSFIRTWNLAAGGSVVDPDITKPVLGLHGASLKSQVIDKFKAVYADPHDTAHWRSDNTLFALWFGLNDILIPASGNQQSPVRSIMTSYRVRIDQLYGSGARNLLLINVPPVFRGHRKKKFVVSEKRDILRWNEQLLELRNSIVSKYSDVTVFVFDAYALWNDALDDHTLFPATEKLQRVDLPCDKYSKGTRTYDLLEPKCKVPVNQYFWLNNLHATYPIHNATAGKIVEDCFAHAERTGYCL